jgi:hypothetical protein
MSNDHPELLEIHPYLEGSSTWVFNDESTGLDREPFVSGMSEMISELVSAKGIDGSRGITIQFSNQAFSGCDVVLNYIRPGDPTRYTRDGEPEWNRYGNWYEGRVNGSVMQGWLCPALGKYFGERPKTIAVRILPLREGVDPFRGSGDGMRFVDHSN